MIFNGGQVVENEEKDGAIFSLFRTRAIPGGVGRSRLFCLCRHPGLEFFRSVHIRRRHKRVGMAIAALIQGLDSGPWLGALTRGILSL